MKNINKIKIDVNHVYEIGQDKLPFIAEASIKDDEELFAKVCACARSTYDSTVLTKVGSPVVNNGVVSSISASNYFTHATINFGDNFTIISPLFNLSADVSGANCLVEADEFAIQVRQNKVYCMRYTTNKNTYDVLEGTTTLETGTDYLIKFEQTYDGTNYVINAYLSSDYGATWNLEKTLTRTNGAYYNSGLIYVGRRENAGYPSLYVSGPLDLKTFVCFKKGVEVLKVNKSGVDKVVADDFTVVGTPTLSNGILDGITSGNYLTAPAIDLGDNFEIISPLFKATGGSTTECILETDEVAIQIRNGKTYCWRYTTNKNTYDLLEGVTTLELGKYYLIKYTQTFDGTNYTSTTYLSNDFGATWTLERTLTRTEASYYNGGLIYFGRRQNAGYPNLFSNPLNLNHCKISSSKGDKYYPCVYIPYSESNTGSKIADFTYRLPVQYAYEINGFAPYYTIDEVTRNFTLPLGELYGIVNTTTDKKVAELQNAVTSLIMPDYENGISITVNTDYTAPSDGWVGIYANNSGGTFTINGEQMGYVNQNGSNNDAVFTIFPVAKDDVVKLTAGDSFTFYACKGVN